jgi:ATP phosphoribosyltransferase regulatory subunit HisZ
MGVQNFKVEVESFQFQLPVQLPPGISPQKTEADFTVINELASRVSQLTLMMGQFQQAIVQQAFTRAAPQPAAEPADVADEVRRLTERLDQLEARLG